MNPLHQLLSVSRAIGADHSMTLAGGGNTSLKGLWKGRPAIWVKASGRSLETLGSKDLVRLELEPLLALRGKASVSETRLQKVLASAGEGKGPRPSVETLMHAFVPFPCVLHAHADAAVAVVDNPSPARHTRACWGGRVALVPYRLSGHANSMDILGAVRRGGAELRGVMIEKHGLVSWGADPAQALRRLRSLVSEAAAYVSRRDQGWRPRQAPSLGAKLKLMRELRKLVADSAWPALAADFGREARGFAASRSARRLCLEGPATPNHLNFCKPRALYINEAGTRSLDRALRGYRRWYQSYFERHRRPFDRSLDPHPRIIVVKNLGFVALGRDRREALRTREVFRHGLKVRRWAEALGGFRSIRMKDRFEFEYWPLEKAHQ